ncbi:hypothetical protein LTR56_006070 [Elasticomyces elasticus]|nr:hypothetical protein LTR56_006070 [Elasticomyces elasticus]KAK3667668.1 hypothetical protein LTR22_001483 [Elasticomyces elasticus]KAK5767178.1 hypothetical protein LTS12_002636 [Elasticomyces elasticus]
MHVNYLRMAEPQEAQTTNALSILLSAAPSEVVASVESVFQSLSAALLETSSQPTATPTSRSTNSPPSRPTQTASNQPPGRPNDRPTSRPDPSTTSQITSVSTTATSSAVTSITSTLPSSVTSTATPSATIAASSGGGQLKNASVAGIATGLAAGMYILRRRQQGKPLPFFGAKGSRGSQRSSKRGSKRIFPEVAWLYDPARSPKDAEAPREGMETEMQEDRHFSTASLIPEPREGAVEIGPAPDSPPQRPSSPLLAPLGRAESPRDPRRNSHSPSSYGRRSGSGSPVGRRHLSGTDLTARPMSSIYEEHPPRPSMDARTGLLAPGSAMNMQRHST